MFPTRTIIVEVFRQVNINFQIIFNRIFLARIGAESDNEYNNTSLAFDAGFLFTDIVGRFPREPVPTSASRTSAAINHTIIASIRMPTIIPNTEHTATITTVINMIDAVVDNVSSSPSAGFVFAGDESE